MGRVHDLPKRLQGVILALGMADSGEARIPSRLAERLTLPLFDFIPEPQELPRRPRRQVNPRERQQLADLLTVPVFREERTEQAREDAAIIPDALLDITAGDFGELEADAAHVEWSVGAVLQLHSVLLDQSLRALNGRGNGEQKREILEWIFEPDLVGFVDKNGTRAPVYNWQVPWSFLFCCKLEGLNPEVIREFLLEAMPSEAKRFFH